MPWNDHVSDAFFASRFEHGLRTIRSDSGQAYNPPLEDFQESDDCLYGRLVRSELLFMCCVHSHTAMEGLEASTWHGFDRSHNVR